MNDTPKFIIESLIKEGYSQRRMAKKIGRSLRHVCNMLSKYGLKTTAAPGPKPKNPKEDKYCFCGKKIGRKSKKYCSLACQQRYAWNCKYEKMSKEGVAPNPQSAKKYLAQERGYKCEICLLDEWNGSKLPLILDHIDGNSYNWLLTNLRLVCSNCDSQLPTYKGRNKGKGRYSRAVRYREGLSY